MADSYFSGSTFDDVLRWSIQALRSHGYPIRPRKGSAVELTGLLLELTNPRARLSRTETKGMPFSCLGELCWYLAGSNDLTFIAYYLPGYKKYADGPIIFGGYGPRLLNWRGIDQLANVISILKNKHDSRQAVIQLFDAADLIEEHNDIPCTCTLQFLLRNQKLHMFVNMRSNDVFLGFPHDVFSFTMIQEIIARVLSVDLGTYKHAVGSLHLYDQNMDAAQRFLDEGWQSTQTPMPPMPTGDPWPAIHSLLTAESEIRKGDPPKVRSLESVDAYWADLIRMLQVFKYRKTRQSDKIKELASAMSSAVYDPFIEKQLAKLP